MTTTTASTKEINVEYEDENGDTIYKDENGKEWYSKIFLFEIRNLELNEDCEYTDGIKYLIKKHLIENYQLLEIDCTYDENGAGEILYERIEREWGEYVTDYSAEFVYQTYGDYSGGVYEQKEYEEFTAKKEAEEW